MSASHAPTPPLTYIGQDDVTKLLRPDVLIGRLEEALGKFSLQSREGPVDQERGRRAEGNVGVVEGNVGVVEKHMDVVQPARTVIDVQPHGGFLAVMPGYLASQGALATKLVSFYPRNVEPYATHQAWVMLFEPSNGSLLAMLDGDSITAIRTAVTSAIATKHLARSDARILAILGSGVQARSHYDALSLVRKFDEVRVWSRNVDNARRFAAALGGAAVVTPCANVREAVQDADVICTVTFATSPILMADWVKPGAHINAVGACRPDWQELDPALMRSATVYCDSREACLQEAGDVILSKCDVYAEIGEVIAGRKQAHPECTTVFKSVGMAVEDVVSAKLVYDAFVSQ